MFEKLKAMIYDLVVWSGIMNYIVPLLPYIIEYVSSPKKNSNYSVTDASGASLLLTRCNGKNYPMVDLDRLLSVPDLKIRKDDIILCSYPKAGCHWVHEILNMLIKGEAKLTAIGKEAAGGIELFPEIFLDSLPSPRILNSHLPYDELPKGIKENKSKIVLLVRNPKDTVVSFYNHHLSLVRLYGYDGEFKDYFQLFMDGQLEYGSYFDHLLGWDKVIKSKPVNPILLMTYEEWKSQPVESVQKVAKFMEVPVTDQYAEEILKACEFERMKAVRNKQGDVLGKMYRKGIVGDWRNWLTDEQSKAIDEEWRNRMMDCIYKPVY